MDAAQIAIVLGAASALGTVYNGWRAQQTTRDTARDEGSQARLELAFKMQEQQIQRMALQIDNQAKQLQLESERSLDLDRQLQECKQGRHQLEVQVEILKLQVGGGHAAGE